MSDHYGIINGKIVYERMLTLISRKEKLISIRCSVEGKEYKPPIAPQKTKYVEFYNISSNNISSFTNILVTQSRKDVVDCLLYILDMFYDLSDDSKKNDKVQMFLAQKQFETYRDEVFNFINKI